MPIKDKDRVARANYKKKVTVVRIELYLTDEDIKQKFADRREQGEPTSTYIKRLIREDIKKG